MDTLQYWAIADRDVEIQNPITDRKLRLLEDYCDVRDGLKVLDVGCGKAWLMRQWADRHTIEGTGIDINPRFLEVARRKPPAKGKISFINGPASGLKVEPGSFDIAMCLGATFALGELPQAIDWLVTAVKPGGVVVIGDLTLRHKPSIHRGDLLPSDTITLMGVIERHGAEVSATISASEADFERYASHHRHATLTWAREHPDHPDHAEALAKSRQDWIHFQKTIRPYVGWTIFVARRFGG